MNGHIKTHCMKAKMQTMTIPEPRDEKEEGVGAKNGFGPVLGGCRQTGRLKGGSDPKGSSSAGSTEAAEGATLFFSPPQLWSDLDLVESLLIKPPV